MATKRSAPAVHPSRRDQVPNEPRRKRQKPNNAGPKSFPKAHPVNELKSQIRSLKRLLQRDDGLPANVRVEKERALQTAQHELAETQKAKERSEMIGKYHKVRFFDGQKASRRLKKAKKELQNCEDGASRRAQLEEDVQDAEVDVNYAKYYPLDRHYVSLFPRKKLQDSEVEDGDSQEDTVERKGDAEMWQKVKQCMAEGTLDALRNGKLTEAHESTTTGKLLQHATGHAPRKERDKATDDSPSRQVEDDQESDGGFFE